jgi:DNA-directed RNA polymerase specialized sigma24 family protein
MVWQDAFSRPGQHVDVEQERELRLAAQAAAGADWALAALVARYQPPVTRYLTRLIGDPERARTEAEQIFVRMDRRLHGPHGGANLRLWLLRASTEAGLTILQQPRRPAKPQLAGPGGPIGLLPGETTATAKKLRAGLGTLATLTGSTARQMRRLVWSAPAEDTSAGRRSHSEGAAAQKDYDRAEGWGPSDDALDEQDPRTALRHRLVRAVLAELPYGDAQCLALHLVAGLNQREVARALGITPSAVRRRVVQGLQLFAKRYEAAVASLGLPPEVLQEPELVAEEPERDEMMVTGEVAAVSAPLPYLADEPGPDAVIAEAAAGLPATEHTTNVPGAEGAALDLSSMETSPLPRAMPQEIIVDAYPPEPLLTRIPVVTETSDQLATGAHSVPAADGPAAGTTRLVPVLTRPGRGNGDALSREPWGEEEARVVPVLTAKMRQERHHGAAQADAESLDPLAPDIQMVDPGDKVSMPPDRELASAAPVGYGGLPLADAMEL